MSALDGFYSTWNKARETFGAGTPDDGSQFDGSARLRQMKAGVEAAAPDARWQGTASEAYAAANKKHADIYEKLADLDQKMAAEIKNAANIATAGRESLDRTRDWVSSWQHRSRTAKPARRCCSASSAKAWETSARSSKVPQSA